MNRVDRALYRALRPLALALDSRPLLRLAVLSDTFAGWGLFNLPDGVKRGPRNVDASDAGAIIGCKLLRELAGAPAPAPASAPPAQSWHVPGPGRLRSALALVRSAFRNEAGATAEGSDRAASESGAFFLLRFVQSRIALARELGIDAAAARAEPLPSAGSQSAPTITVRASRIEPGTLLLAHPFLEPPFARRVVLVLEHDPLRGTIGVVINQPRHECEVRNIAAAFTTPVPVIRSAALRGLPRRRHRSSQSGSSQRHPPFVPADDESRRRGVGGGSERPGPGGSEAKQPSAGGESRSASSSSSHAVLRGARRRSSAIGSRRSRASHAVSEDVSIGEAFDAAGRHGFNSEGALNVADTDPASFRAASLQDIGVSDDSSEEDTHPSGDAITRSSSHHFDGAVADLSLIRRGQRRAIVRNRRRCAPTVSLQSEAEWEAAVSSSLAQASLGDSASDSDSDALRSESSSAFLGTFFSRPAVLARASPAQVLLGRLRSESVASELFGRDSLAVVLDEGGGGEEGKTLGVSLIPRGPGLDMPASAAVRRAQDRFDFAAWERRPFGELPVALVDATTGARFGGGTSGNQGGASAQEDNSDSDSGEDDDNDADMAASANVRRRVGPSLSGSSEARSLPLHPHQTAISDGIARTAAAAVAALSKELGELSDDGAGDSGADASLRSVRHRLLVEDDEPHGELIVEELSHLPPQLHRRTLLAALPPSLRPWTSPAPGARRRGRRGVASGGGRDGGGIGGNSIGGGGSGDGRRPLSDTAHAAADAASSASVAIFGGNKVFKGGPVPGFYLALHTCKALGRFEIVPPPIAGLDAMQPPQPLQPSSATAVKRRGSRQHQQAAAQQQPSIFVIRDVQDAARQSPPVPTEFVFFAGASRWRPGQLDEELNEGSWVPVAHSAVSSLVKANAAGGEGSGEAMWARLYRELGGEFATWGSVANPE